MMKNTLLLIFILLTVSLSAQKKPISYYLPDNISYDKNIPTPEEFFGFQIGEQHVSHDQLVSYMRELDRLSDRITSKILGRTHENRLVMALTITSPENQRNIDKINIFFIYTPFSLLDNRALTTLSLLNIACSISLSHINCPLTSIPDGVRSPGV